MKNWHISFVSFNVLLFMAIHFIELLYPSSVLQHLLSLLGFIILAAILIVSRNKIWVFPAILTFLALLIWLMDKQTIWTIWEGFRRMRGLIPLIVLIPLLEWVIKEEAYIQAVFHFFKKRMTSHTKIYLLLMILMTASTYFLGLGAVLFIFSFGTAIFVHNIKWTSELYKTIIQGFALTSLWSLTEPSMVFALQATKAPVFLTIALGFGLWVLGVMVSVLLFRFGSKRKIEDYRIQWEVIEITESELKLRSLLKEFIAILVCFYLLAVVGLLLNIGIINVIPLVIIVLSVFYFLIKRKWKTFLKQAEEYFNKKMEMKFREMGIVIASGLTIVTLNQSGWGEQFFSWLSVYTNLQLIMPFIIVILGFLMPPTVSMVLLVSVLAGSQTHYSPHIIILILLTGNALAFLVSPVTMPTLILSSVNQRTPFQNGLGINWRFAIVFYLLAELYISVINNAIG